MVSHLKWAVAFTLISFAVTAPVRADEAATTFKKAEVELSYKNKKKKIKVELAENGIQHAYGLMNRTRLGENEGMLFIFEEESTREFWMKNTLINLDIAYIDKNKTIVDIQTMKAITSVLQTNVPTYPSKKPAMYALEVNAGWFKKNKFRIGTTLKILSGPTSK